MSVGWWESSLSVLHSSLGDLSVAAWFVDRFGSSPRSPPPKSYLDS